MKYFRYHNSKKLNINIEKINILLHIFWIIQKFQYPNIYGSSMLSITSNVWDILISNINSNTYPLSNLRIYWSCRPCLQRLMPHVPISHQLQLRWLRMTKPILKKMKRKQQLQWFSRVDKLTKCDMYLNLCFVSIYFMIQLSARVT